MPYPMEQSADVQYGERSRQGAQAALLLAKGAETRGVTALQRLLDGMGAG